MQRKPQCRAFAKKAALSRTTLRAADRNFTGISPEYLCPHTEKEYARLRCLRGDYERYSSPSPDFLAQGNTSGLAQRQHTAGLSCGQSFPGWAMYPHNRAPADWHVYPAFA